MPELGSLTRPKPTRTALAFDGDTLNLVFDANAITPQWFDVAQRMSSAGDLYAFAAALADVILEWDVTQDGQPLAPDGAALALLSLPALAAILEAVTAAAIPSDAEGKASAEPSSIPSTGSVPPLLKPLNGQATSPSPVGSASPSPT